MTSTEFSSFLDGISKYPLPVLDASIPFKGYIPLDLSVSNPDLLGIDFSDSTVLERYVNTHLTVNDALVGYGGYLETRNIYQRSAYFNKEDAATERNIHLGMDLWLGAGAPISAPLDGVVHSFAYNQNFGDYGPTIILKHSLNDVVFYTLYGHLSLSSIENLREGHRFKQGEQIATLGDASVNGDYPPHLHFQIIRDLGDWVGDYPGVCSKNDFEFYVANCPDPNLLLKLG